jgi:hypothetical protein
METLGRFLFGLVESAILRTLRTFFPSSENRSSPDYPTLRARNFWINGVALLLFIAAFGLTLLYLPEPDVGPRLLALGVACGVAVAASFAWICLATLPFGRARYREFWRFHQLHYDIDTMGAVALALPLAILGAICALALLAL